jgi:hypothetical protein
MTKEEQAVIDAAEALRRNYDDYDVRGGLSDAVDALILARAAAPPTIDQLCDTIRAQFPGRHDGAPARARIMIVDNIRRRSWPASDAREVGELDADIIRDTRNAGPYIWKVWADALRALNIEPVWAKELEV